MKIKRYTAPSMRAALALVRPEQGPDAVILSSRRSDEGIEVIAAVDYDEGWFKHMARKRPAQPVAPINATDVAAPAAVVAAPAVNAAPRAVAPPMVARKPAVAPVAAATVSAPAAARA